MNFWIVVTTRGEFLEDCQEYKVYGTNNSYLPRFSQMQANDRLLIQLGAQTGKRNFAYVGPYIVSERPHDWARIIENRIPWFKVNPNNGPRWLRQYPWCIFLLPSSEFIDLPRVLKDMQDPSDGLIANERAIRIIKNLTRVEYFPPNQYEGYRSYRGVWVRSRAEYMIDNWFAERGIVTYYERPIFLSNYLFIPDWYIPRLKVYVEYLGLVGNKDYDIKWEKKKSIYENNKLRYIILTESDLKNLDISIPKKIPGIKKILDY